uniref:Uncharacterized protein n=1 Tax=Rhizophora mucronata TaxID=61149 RepID=A0A2P2IRC1_RHIMU
MPEYHKHTWSIFSDICVLIEHWSLLFSLDLAMYHMANPNFLATNH